MLAEINRIPVLNNASDLNTGQCKGLCHVLESFCFRNRLVEWLPFEIDDRSIGMSGSSSYMNDVVASLFEERNLDIRILSTFLFKNFYAGEVILMSGQAAVIPINLPVQNDSGRSRS